jgi:hypothetical protein
MHTHEVALNEHVYVQSDEGEKGEKIRIAEIHRHPDYDVNDYVLSPSC